MRYTVGVLYKERKEKQPMKKTLIKLLSSAMALSLVLASANIAAAPAETIKAEAKAKTEKTEISVIKEDGILAAIEAKAKAETPVVFEAAAPEAAVKAAPEAVVHEAEEVEALAEKAEPDMVWDISACESDDVAMAFYSDNISVTPDVITDAAEAKTGTVVISGTGEMEAAVYTNFITFDSYLNATEKAFENYYGVEVELVYDEASENIIALEQSLEIIDVATGEHLYSTPEMMATLDLADFLEFSPTEIIIEEGVTSVSEYAFLACTDLTEVILPSTIREIAPSAFQYCTQLERVVLPEGITIDSSAFYHCDSLAVVVVADEAYYENLANGVVARSVERTLSPDEIALIVEGEGLEITAWF